MQKNIILTGVGGQGTVLASKLIAAASLAKGYEVMSAETIGMARCSAICAWARDCTVR